VKRAQLGIAGTAGLALGVGLALAAAAARAAEPQAPGRPQVLADASSGMQAAPAGLPATVDRTAVAPVELETHEGYNASYIFGMTRGVAWSTISPALKPLLFVLTVPLDIVLLPFAAIGGLFG
jgi:hypothetical protein